MPLPSITDEDLRSVDVTAPLPISDSPMAREDPERARLLQAKMGNPIELQQYTTAELRIAIEQRVKKEMDELGYLSDKTMKYLDMMNNALSDLHKNLYGSKSLQVSVQGKITHAQVASLMRQSARENVASGVVPEDGEE